MCTEEIARNYSDDCAPEEIIVRELRARVVA